MDKYVGLDIDELVKKDTSFICYLVMNKNIKNGNLAIIRKKIIDKYKIDNTMMLNNMLILKALNETI
jgi:hypothetical protein